MKPERMTVIAFGVAFGVWGIGWLLLPWLQDSQRTVDAEASVHVERARRLLQKYDANLAYSALLADQLRDADVEVDPQALTDEVGEDYKEQHAALWAAFEPKDWQDPPRPARAGYGNVAGQVREALASRIRLLAENDSRLTGALSEVERALDITAGAASGKSHAEALRFRSVINYHQGLADRVRAALKRTEAGPYRHEILALADRAAESAAAKTLVADSGIDAHIRKIQQKAAEVETQLVEDGKALTGLDTRIRDLENRLASAQTRAEQARAALEKLRSEGVDFSDPTGGAAFEARVTEQDAIYRKALREVQLFGTGDYLNAEIDASGDFLKGRYLQDGSSSDLQVEPGLAHYRNERTVLATRIDDTRQALDDFGVAIGRLENIRDAHRATQAHAVKQIAEASSAAATAYAELNRIESEAFAIEDAALKTFDQSISSAQQAAAAVNEWIDDARDRAAGLSPEAKDRSADDKRAGDGWMGGFIAAQAADARLAKAWIYYDRYDAYRRTAESLAAVQKSLTVKEGDAEAEQTKSLAARDAGVDEVTKAMEVLEKVHRAVDRHWTIAAQAAGTSYLLALFGQKDYVADAAQRYRDALKGRETERYTEKLAARLQQLEGR